MAILTFEELCDDDRRIFFPRLNALRDFAENGPRHEALDYGQFPRLAADGLIEPDPAGRGWWRITDDGLATLASIDKES